MPNLRISCFWPITKKSCYEVWKYECVESMKTIKVIEIDWVCVSFFLSFYVFWISNQSHTHQNTQRIEVGAWHNPKRKTHIIHHLTHFFTYINKQKKLKHSIFSSNKNTLKAFLLYDDMIVYKWPNSLLFFFAYSLFKRLYSH